jgi:hypothetical protein
MNPPHQALFGPACKLYTSDHIHLKPKHKRKNLLSLWSNRTQKENNFFVIGKLKPVSYWSEPTFHPHPTQKTHDLFSTSNRNSLVVLDRLAMKRGYSESPSASVGPPQSRFKHNPEGKVLCFPFILICGLWCCWWVLRLIWELMDLGFVV